MLNMKKRNFIIEPRGITIFTSLRKNDIFLKRRYSNFIRRQPGNSWCCCAMIEFSLAYLGIEDHEFVFSYLTDHDVQLKPNSLNSLFRKTLDEAGVKEKFTLMLLRKQAINKLSKDGISSEECMALRGWAEKSSLTYYNVRNEAQQGHHSQLLWNL